VDDPIVDVEIIVRHLICRATTRGLHDVAAEA
jgi:hypothetical protein